MESTMTECPSCKGSMKVRALVNYGGKKGCVWEDVPCISCCPRRRAEGETMSEQDEGPPRTEPWPQSVLDTIAAKAAEAAAAQPAPGRWDFDPYENNYTYWRSDSGGPGLNSKSEIANYLNALEAERDALREKAAMADEVYKLLKLDLWNLKQMKIPQPNFWIEWKQNYEVLDAQKAHHE